MHYGWAISDSDESDRISNNLNGKKNLFDSNSNFKSDPKKFRSDLDWMNISDWFGFESI